MYKTKISLVILAVVLTGLLFPMKVISEDSLKIRTIRGGVPIRPTPQITLDRNLITIVEKGHVFYVIEKLDNWYLVLLPDKKKGYVHKSVVEELTEAVEPIAPPTTKVVPEKEPEKIQKPILEVKEKTEPAFEPPERIVAIPPKTQPGVAIDQPTTRKAIIATILARYGYFSAVDSAFHEIYENGPVYVGEFRLSGRKITGWLECGFREHEGKFSFTGEKTKISVVGVELGVLYRLATRSLQPYVGTGVGYYMFSEKNEPLGEAKQNKIGFSGITGISIIPTKNLLLDLRLKYYTCRMKPADYDINIGGLSLELGIGVIF